MLVDTQSLQLCRQVNLLLHYLRLTEILAALYMSRCQVNCSFIFFFLCVEHLTPAPSSGYVNCGGTINGTGGVLLSPGEDKWACLKS